MAKRFKDFSTKANCSNPVVSYVVSVTVFTLTEKQCWKLSTCALSHTCIMQIRRDYTCRERARCNINAWTLSSQLQEADSGTMFAEIKIKVREFLCVRSREEGTRMYLHCRDFFWITRPGEKVCEAILATLMLARLVDVYGLLGDLIESTPPVRWWRERNNLVVTWGKEKWKRGRWQKTIKSWLRAKLVLLFF